MKLLSILIIGLLQLNFGVQKENGDLSHLFETRWILNDKDGHISIQDLDTLSFIRQDSPLTEDLPYHLKYAGLTFQQNGILIEHVWNKCGTGNPPDHYKANWEIINQTEGQILRIENSRKWDGEYIVATLEKQNLQLIRKK